MFKATPYGIIPFDTKTPYHRTKKPKDAIQKFRSSNKWRVKAEQIKERDRYLCLVCLDKGIYNYKDLSVHHIVKLADNKDLALEDSNLITLCTKHHKDAEAGLIDANYLRSLIKDGEQ